MAKVFVALSGGVDSSVAALLLKRQGYDVTGVFMRCYNVDGCAEQDAEDARRVAEHLSIPFYVFNFEKEYKKKVVEYMVDGYRRGITPNPDVMCNKEIKFGLFLGKAIELGADYIATGHYVKLVVSKLFTARDSTKDQSYFLWTLSQDQLRYCLFPIGDYLKTEVREMARKAGLPTAEKKDSQGICFLGKVSLDDFLKNYIKPKKGPIVTTEGKKIGEHQGVYFYTIGQRQGLGIGGGEPYYIADKDIRTNTLVVVKGSSDSALYGKEIELTDVNFISPQYSNILKNVGMSVMARVRYRQPLAPATLYKLPTINYKLEFDSPIKFIAPGQSAVFYHAGDPSTSHSTLRVSDPMGSGSKSPDFEMLGGGIIL